MVWIAYRALNPTGRLPAAGPGGVVLGALLVLLLLVPPAPAAAKYASIVIAADTGEVLHAANADTRNYPASLTKMMTLYLAFEALEGGRLRLDDRLSVSRRAAGMPPSRLGVSAGGTIRVEEAILGLVIKSANDVAVVLAEALGGTESEFAEVMTRRARSLGMERTTFRNASGLHHPSQLSTARDMARLSRALLSDFPQYYPYFSRAEFRYGGRIFRTHNHLTRGYAGADGIKTGYIRQSGFNLATSAVRNGRRLIGVVFGGRTAQSRDRHMAALLDGGFAKLPALVARAPDVGPPPPPNPRYATALAVASVLAEPLEPLEPLVAEPAAPAIAPAMSKPAIEVAEVVTAEGDTAEGSRDGGTVIEADPATEAAVRRPPSSGPYGVQVGAYYDVDQAKRAATRAVERIPHLLADTEVAVSKIRGRRGWIYRGRLVGLTLGRANEACRLLRAKRQDCLVVQAGGSVEVALGG